MRGFQACFGADCYTYHSILDLGGIAVSQRSANKDVAFSQRMCNLLIVDMLRV